MRYDSSRLSKDFGIQIVSKITKLHALATDTSNAIPNKQYS